MSGSNKRKSFETDQRIKRKTINIKSMVIAYAVILFLVGVQVGIIIFPGFYSLNVVAQIVIIMGYWAAVVAGFLALTNLQIRERYDKPMRRLSEVTKQVSEGDFSVYIEPPHTADKYDYIDVMFLDFNKMIEELGSIETLKNDFVSNVSHEIKTPLAIIRNYTSMLKKDNLPPETRQEYMKAIIEATDKLSLLVSNILKLNRLENQAIEATPEPYDLCAQLSECILQFESLWEEKEIEIDVNIEDRAIITADEELMEIVWNNLLSNAIKFTDSGGKVSIHQTSDTHSITVLVSDTGCGMSQETVRHIFDKFYQGDTSHAKEGNGLGLALAGRIVEKAGGTLSVKSELGKGTTFKAQLEV